VPIVNLNKTSNISWVTPAFYETTSIKVRCVIIDNRDYATYRSITLALTQSPNNNITYGLYTDSLFTNVKLQLEE